MFCRWILEHVLILMAFSFPKSISGRNIPSDKPKLDIEYAGNFKLVGCTSNAPQLRQMIGEAYSDLQKAIAQVDTTNGVYNAFFKDVLPSDIKSTLAKIATGNFIVKGKNRYNPEIACANPDQPRMWKACQNSHISGGYIINTNYVYLCPRFFEEPALPVLSDCGKVLPDKTLMQGSSILDHQLTTLVNVISRLYIAQPFLRPEQSSANDCMALPSSQSRINPLNYALFVGNVKAGCTDFPTDIPRKSAQESRELLEVDHSMEARTIDLNSNCADPVETNLDSAVCPLDSAPP